MKAECIEGISSYSNRPIVTTDKKLDKKILFSYHQIQKYIKLFKNSKLIAITGSKGA